MKYNPNLHHRRSIRLKSYDYTQAGEYFLTLCIQNRECVLGRIENEEVKLSDFGEIVKEEWLRTALLRSDVELDEFIIMPNHMHAIIALCRGTSRDERKGVPLKERVSRKGELQFAPTKTSTPFRSPSGTVGAIVRGFKIATTKQVNELRGTPGMRLWQRNYYEHVIRDEKDLERIREYVRLNPTRWPQDEENPSKSSKVLNHAG